MHSRLTLDKAGRIVIPKPLREELGRIEPGDTLEAAKAMVSASPYVQFAPPDHS